MLFHYIVPSPYKGQLISKWFLVSSNSSKKRTNELFFLLWRLTFVHFLEEIEDTKNHFKIIWPLAHLKSLTCSIINAVDTFTISWTTSTKTECRTAMFTGFRITLGWCAIWQKVFFSATSILSPLSICNMVEV